MTISALIHEQLDSLAQDFAGVARAQLPAAAGLSDKELRNSVRDILLAVADDIEQPQTANHQRAKAQGGHPDHAPDLTLHAQVHAARRLAQGFTQDQLVAEYRALRASLSRRVEQGSFTMGELVRLNEALDQAMLESIRCYAAQLEHAQELFIGALGHDLRNPLGAIAMSAEVILRDEAMDSWATVAAVRVKNSANRMGRLIEDLIDFTRTRLGGTLPIRPARMELVAVLRDVVDELRALHPTRDLKLQAHGEAWGRWDAGRIAQLVSNLVGNAIQYGDPQQPVTVGAALDHDQARITVHNEGVPIPEDGIAHIFDPLVRLAQPDAEDRAGTSGPSVGLGLYICREVVLAHGGRIEVASAPGQGTTFTVSLPAEPAGPPAQAPGS